MNRSQRKRLSEAIALYDAENPNYDDTFDEVGRRIGEAKCATKLDISALVFWKRIRVGDWATEFLNLADDTVRTVTSSAFAGEVPPRERLEELSQLPGFGSWGSVSSTLLAAWNPTEFGVMDKWAWVGLRRLGLLQEVHDRGYLTYLGLVHTIQEELEPSPAEIRARDIDKGLFMLGKPESLEPGVPT